MARATVSLWSNLMHGYPSLEKAARKKLEWALAKVGVTKAADIAAYAVTHDSLVSTLPSDLAMATILLHAPIDIIAKRICLRGRAAETTGNEDESAMGVPDEYLRKLQDAHTTFFASLPDDAKVCVDATATPEKVAAEVYAGIASMVDMHLSSEPPDCVSPASVLMDPASTVVPMDAAMC